MGTRRRTTRGHCTRQAREEKFNAETLRHCVSALISKSSLRNDWSRQGALGTTPGHSSGLHRDTAVGTRRPAVGTRCRTTRDTLPDDTGTLHSGPALGKRNSTQRRGDGESQWSSLCVPPPSRLCANFLKVRLGMTGPEGDGVSLGLETRGTTQGHSGGDAPPD